MEINLYSVLSVITITNLFIIVFLMLFNITGIISKVSLKFVILFIFLIGLRLIIPIEFIAHSKSIDSFKIMPQIDLLLNRQLNISLSCYFKFKIYDLLLIIWIIGIVISIFHYIYMYYVLIQRIKYIPKTTNEKILSCLEKIKKQYCVRFGIRIIENNSIKSPCEFGFFHQTILLNDYPYKSKELYYILLHEIIHYTNKSNWIKLFIDFICLVFWWNPIMILFKNCIYSLLEIYVDLNITKNLDKDSKIEYLQCILKVYQISDKNSSIILMNSLVNISEEKFFKKRFKIITISKRINLLLCTLIFIFSLSYLFISYKFVFQPAYNPSESELIVPQFNSQNSYIIKKGDVYILYYNNEIFAESKNVNQLPEIPIKNF